MEKANGYEVKNGKLYYFSNMLGGCEIEFKDLQEICDMANHYNEEFWGLDQRLTFWEAKAEETRKETAKKFASLVEFHSVSTIDENGIEQFSISALGLKEILHEEFGIPYDEIFKEITGVKENGET